MTGIVASQNFSTFIAQLNAALRSSTNCLVVIAARPTRIFGVFRASKAQIVFGVAPISDGPSVIGVFPLRIDGGHASHRCDAEDCRPVVPEHSVRRNKEAVATR